MCRSRAQGPTQPACQQQGEAGRPPPVLRHPLLTPQPLHTADYAAPTILFAEAAARFMLECGYRSATTKPGQAGLFGHGGAESPGPQFSVAGVIVSEVRCASLLKDRAMAAIR